MKHLSMSFVSFLLLAACGSSQPPAEEPVADEPVSEEPAAVSRTAEECGPVLDHMQEVVSEAIDREGMMTACQNEWTQERVDCMTAATNDADVEACW